MKFPAHCITVKDIYGTDDPKCPEGYEFTGEFRVPVVDDIFRDKACLAPYKVTPHDFPFNSPRLILRPVPVYSDSDILNFMICQIQNYNLGGCISDVYQDVGWKSADNFNRNAIRAAMRRQNWPHKS